MQIPLMPKGLEHNLLRLLGIKPKQVQIPLMPKGLEHMHAGNHKGGRAGCSYL